MITGKYVDYQKPTLNHMVDGEMHPGKPTWPYLPQLLINLFYEPGLSESRRAYLRENNGNVTLQT